MVVKKREDFDEKHPCALERAIAASWTAFTTNDGSRANSHSVGIAAEVRLDVTASSIWLIRYFHPLCYYHEPSQGVHLTMAFKANFLANTTLLNFCFLIALISLLGPSKPSSPSIHSKRDHLNNDCTTELAKDLYGLGVRLGVYFQWFSGWVANTFLSNEVAGALDANAIFMFALLIAMVRSTVTNDLTQIDAHILLQLCAGTMMTVLSLWGYRSCIYRREGVDAIRHFGGFGTHLRILLGAAVAWYSAWFYHTGVGGLPNGLGAFSKEERPEACDLAQVVVFGSLLIDPVIRWGLFADSIALLVYLSPMLLLGLFAGVTRVRKMVILAKGRHFETSSRLRFATGARQRTLDMMSYVLAILTFMLSILMMTIIEVSLNENHAIGVLGTKASYFGQILTPSQLIPMLIGTFSFVRILYICWEIWLSGRDDISPSLGRSPSTKVKRKQPKSIRGLNILRLFSDGLQGREATQTGDSNSSYRSDVLALRIDQYGFWHSVLITWLPWISLWYSWPWTDTHGQALSQDDESIPLQQEQQQQSNGQLVRFQLEERSDQQKPSHSDSSSSDSLQHESVERPVSPLDVV